RPEGFDFFDLDTRMELGALPLMQAAKKHGKKLDILLTYVAFTDQNKGGAYLHTAPEEYAEFVLATFQHLKAKYGLVPGSFEPLLEPDLAGHWTPASLGQAVAAAVGRLHENGFDPRIVAPSVSDVHKADDWLDGLSRAPEAAKAIGEISYHRYYGGPENVLIALATQAAKRGIETAMLEYWFGKATHDLLFDDLTLANVSAWQGRTDYTFHEIAKDGRIRLAPDIVMNRLYFQAIRPGARRIAATGGSREAIRATAFLAPGGDTSLILDSLSGGMATIENLPPGPYLQEAAYEDGTTADHEIVVEANHPLSLAMPAAGVMTLRAQKIP
ncbi:MAG: hypothetical protein ORN49_03045, partial [Rhodobacteraceae bacterium]|nr:hypothetical protein [Paracoccaceae bacterium]